MIFIRVWTEYRYIYQIYIYINIQIYTKASDSGEFTAGDVDRCKITLGDVDSILTSQRDETLKV